MFAFCSAYRDVDESEQDFMGSKLVVSFANPAKHYDNHAIRPQSNGLGTAVAGVNGKLGVRANSGAASGLITGRTGLGSKAGFSDRLSPIGSFPNARGRGLWPVQAVRLTSVSACMLRATVRTSELRCCRQLQRCWPAGGWDHGVQQ